jgi:hypothetical protein
MRIYLSGLSLPILLRYRRIIPEEKLNVLLSFGRPTPDNYAFYVTHRKELHSLILDSGTWTLNYSATQNKMIITLEGYKGYALAQQRYVDFLFNYDSDFTEAGFATNLANQRYLERAGLDPVPVVHDISGPEIDYYLDRGYPVIALGSSQISSDKTVLSIAVNKLLSHGPVDIHLFGNAKYEFLAEFPIFSCDISTWSRAAGHGQILYWNQENPGPNKRDKIQLEAATWRFKKQGIPWAQYPCRRQLEEYLEDTLGITYHDLTGVDGLFYRQLVNTHYFVTLQHEVNREHRRQGFFTADN